MLFNLISYIFGVKTKYILDIEISRDKTHLELSIVELKILKVWIFNCCKLTTDDEVIYSIMEDDIFNTFKNEFYYNFIGRLMLFTKEVELHHSHFMVSKLLNSIPSDNIVCAHDTFILNNEKSKLYGIGSMDMEARKLYKRLIKIVKG